ncbi:MAG: hypothetical protein Q8P59_01880, partial [Dehalococcoidia bacterium]|nr:hypothetical protein [Dehalococcoidia bacterium]
VLVVLAIIHLALFSVAFTVNVPVADGAWYYVPLPSLWYDHDLYLDNNIEDLRALLPPGAPFVHPRYNQFVTPTGHVADWFSIGPALTWAVPFTIVAAILGPGGKEGASPVLFATVGLTTAVTFLFGLFLCTFWLARRSSILIAGMATAITWVLSPLLKFAYPEPYFAHIVSSTFVLAFIIAWEKTRQHTQWWRYLLMGLLGGLMMDMRWQNALLLVLPVLSEGQRILALIRSHDWSDLRRWTAHIALATLAAIAGFAPQMVTWWVIFGTPLTLPQGEGFMHWAKPEIISTWFASYYNGLFIWEPVAALGLIGLATLWRRDPLLVAGAFLVFLLQTYVNASAGDWFGGGGFGPRRFDSLIPLFSLGLVMLLVRARKLVRLAIAIASIGWLWIHWVLMTYISVYRSDWLPGDAMQAAREPLGVWFINMLDMGKRIVVYSVSIWKDPALAFNSGSFFSILVGKSPGSLLWASTLLAIAAVTSAILVSIAFGWTVHRARIAGTD